MKQSNSKKHFRLPISKVLLIRPAPKAAMFGDESFVPLGLGYIASALERNNYKVKIMDLLIQRMSDEELLCEIDAFKPDVVGFSAVTPVVKSAYRIAQKIKNKNRDIITVIGGPHATAIPDEGLENNIDFVIKGEGEETVVDLFKNIQKPEKVKGIAFKKNHRIIHTPVREFIKDLDKLSFPAVHLFPRLRLYKGQEALGNKIPVGSIVTSRGCPFHCTFCFKAIFGNRFRARSAENVLEEWFHLKNDFKAKEIAIVDDSFTTDRKRVHKICDYLIKEKINMKWSCPNGIRVDLADYDLLQKMRKAGCYRVALGVESGSQKILDTIGKKITLEQIVDTVNNCRKVGIKTMAFIMLGNLGENRETMEETIRFAIKVKFDYVQFLIAIPYPGSFLYEEIKRNGKIYIDDWDKYGQYEGSACFEYQELNPELLSEMSGLAYRSYYRRPEYLLKQVFNIETYKFLPRRIKAAFRVFFKY